ncbi:MAG: ribonuclease J [Rhodovibrionaceae bacterium]|nr:ribonuclease J [Rhodovibrionaceae bacterium]
MSEFPEADALYFLPLGGTGEIGMNLNLYGHAGRWLMIDLGVTFADDRQPGVDILMADPAFIVERREQLVGLVLTHGHEDHIGAVPYLWPMLRCPIYATPFTAALVRGKLEEAGLHEALDMMTIVPMSGGMLIEPFEIELITLTHSIPEPNALVIRTPLGAVLHTGDWKLDPEPLIGEDFDEQRLRELAEEGVLAMIGDSTNAMVDGDSGSEADVRESLTELVSGLKNRVAITCFASNVARLATVFHVASATGRRVALVGRSLWRILRAATETGYLTDVPPILDEEDIGYLPREEVLIVCTGSQGEGRAALWRIARDEHPNVTLDRGDAVIFSSRIIPGNEVAIGALHNALLHLGVEVITDEDHFVHVSGHPARDELAQMYGWVRPRAAIPVHGEARHLIEHARLAQACQVPHALVAENGDLIRLAPGEAEIVEEVAHGRLALDGSRLVRVDSPVLRARNKMRMNGSAMVTVAVDGGGRLLGEPQVSLQGVFDEELEAEASDEARAAVVEAIARAPKSRLGDDEFLREAARVAVRRLCNRKLGKKPVTQVHLLRL